MDQENPEVSQILDVLQSSMVDWSSHKLRMFPQYEYHYKEYPYAWHDFFLPYIWHLLNRYTPQLGWNVI